MKKISLYVIIILLLGLLGTLTAMFIYKSRYNTCEEKKAHQGSEFAQRLKYLKGKYSYKYDSIIEISERVKKDYRKDANKLMDIIDSLDMHEPDTIYIEREKEDTLDRLYYAKDSIINDDLNLHWKALVLGRLLDMDINYKTYKRITHSIDTVYYPMIVPEFIEKKHSSLNFRFGMTMFQHPSFNVGLELQTRGRLSYGIAYHRLYVEDKQYWLIGFDLKIKLFNFN